jgi:ABC-type lipoprotein export system ATPase subunit
MRTNREFLKSLKVPTASFYLCDFHVHSPGSADTRIGDRFDALSPAEKQLLPKLDDLPKDLAAYDKQAAVDCPVGDFYDLLVKRRDDIARAQGISEGSDWAFLAITDHNVAEYSAGLSQHAWNLIKEKRLVILPGIELDVTFKLDGGKDGCGIHLLCIFPPLTNASDIRLAIAKSSKTDWSPGTVLEVNSISEFVGELRKHPSYPAICIAAHVCSSKGMHSEIRKSLLSNLDAAIARTTGEISSGENSDLAELATRLKDLETKRADADAIHDQALREIGNCGLDALQVRSKQDEKHYRRLHRFKPDKGRAVPITCSDAHTVEKIFANEDALSFLKLSAVSSSMTTRQVFSEIRDRGLRYGDTRFSYSIPSHVTKWIAGVEITPDASDAKTFWPFTSDGKSTAKSFALPLSRNLNCLIGGRGSGKSAAIEAIAFLTKPDEFNDQSKKNESNHPEWYKRAYATICGCQIRICWQSSGEAEFAALEKKTLFESRYFDPNHQHGDMEMTDIDGKEILSHSITPPKVTLFRIHEIEDAAQPDNLRDLFDRIKGDEVIALNDEIDSFRGSLGMQRNSMVELATLISEFTEEKKPLREFVKRKRQFLEVNKPEVKQKYGEIDHASAAETIADEAVDDWEEIIESLAADNRVKATKEYFAALAKKLKNSKGEVRPNCERLFSLVDEKANPNRRKKIADAIGAVSAEFKDFDRDVQAIRDEIAALHKKFRDELTKQGLPPGGKDREAKKKAFDEAVVALDEYRKLCAQWEETLSARKQLHKELEAKCKHRTNLRKETAEKLTKQLALDLDQSVLVIEADARPVADREEFQEWLAQNLAPTLRFKYQDARIRAIVEKGVMPALLRDVLLSDTGAIPYLLVTKEAKAGEGGISIDDHDKFISDTIGRDRLPPEVSKGDVAADFWNDLPEEIRTGLWQFNVEATENNMSRLDAALGLDEVVFDDLPEIRLNDRPLDTQSKPRPLSELSPGQRCSAILPILLLTGDSPLLIDQPEDNLDNRLIRQVIVNILATIKLRRQVIVATHNPNLPVLGDAEQTIILRAVREKACELQAFGNLDSSEVVTYITDIMEGGREAFQYRQTIYQSHWDSAVSK